MNSINPELNRVLIVDDDESSRLVLSKVVEAAGGEPTAVPDGETAVQLVLESIILRNPFRFIMMDIRMPKVNGFQAALRMREGGYKGCIYAVTVYPTGEGLNQSEKSGIDGYFSKMSVNKELCKALLDKALE